VKIIVIDIHKCILFSITFVKKIYLEFLERALLSQDWITLLFICCFLFLALSKYLFPMRFLEFIRLPLSNKYFLVQGRSQEIQSLFNILLFFVQCISTSLFIYILLTNLDDTLKESSSVLFIQIITLYATLIFVKFFIEKIISSIFSIEKIISSYLYQKLTYRNLLSVILLIVNIFIIYIYTPTFYIILSIAGLILVLNGLSLFYSYKTNETLILRNFFYFILYLCTLEILPYYILYKTVI